MSRSLIDYIKQYPTEKEMIIKIFQETSCFGFIKWIGDYESIDGLAVEYIERIGLQILKEIDSYLIYEVATISPNEYDWTIKTTADRLRGKEKVIIIHSVYSKTQNEGFAKKNIKKLKKIAKEQGGLEIVVDTYTPALRHLAEGCDVLLMKEMREGFHGFD